MAMMKSLRTTLQSLRPPEIDDFGLTASLTALAREQERMTGGTLKITLQLDSDLDGLPPSVAAHVYRIVQEGLTNIGKHAKAGRARVALDIRPDKPETRRRWLELTIEDNGCGAADRSRGAQGSGLGLIGMHERVMALGGELDVADLEGRGFRLHAKIPFAAPAGRLR
jgi:two-component system sensor histidine kinase UhpB